MLALGLMTAVAGMVGSVQPTTASAVCAGPEPCCDTGYGPEQSDPACREDPNQSSDGVWVTLVVVTLFVALLLYVSPVARRLRRNRSADPPSPPL